MNRLPADYRENFMRIIYLQMIEISLVNHLPDDSQEISKYQALSGFFNKQQNLKVKMSSPLNSK